MAEEPTREGIIESFRPITGLLDEVVTTAQNSASEEVVRQAHPRLARHAHRNRVMGGLRWMIGSDELVTRIADAPSGFGCLTTEADHNQGRYAFSFPGHPGGVFMIRRTPHDAGEGEYVQQRLNGVLEHAPLADQFKHSPLKVYLSIPSRGAARLIGEHPAWPERVSVLLAELRAAVPVLPRPKTTALRPAVRSTKTTVPEADEVGGRDRSSS
jgi:hypothetical protein